MDKMKHRRLQELDHSDFEIVKGEPDIRGWDVKNTAGKKIGEVEDLVIDAQQKKVRYMVVDLKDNDLDLRSRKVLVPIGLAELHEKEDDVLLPNVQLDQLNALPLYDKDRLDEDMERNICHALGRKHMTVVTRGQQEKATKAEEHSADFYQHDYYNDDNLYKHRLHEAQPANKGKEMSEYEHGLKLWEKRSEGGILPGSDSNENRRARNQYNREGNYSEKMEQERMEMVRNRRNNYEERRNGGHERGEQDDRSHKKSHNTIIDRIKNEGLREE